MEIFPILILAPEEVRLDGTPVKEAIALLIGKLGENITLSNLKVFLNACKSTSLYGHAHPMGEIFTLPSAR